jgi:hypothetical protein
MLADSISAAHSALTEMSAHPVSKSSFRCKINDPTPSEKRHDIRLRHGTTPPKTGDAMSVMGQTEKHSIRVHVFGCAHKLGHCSTQSHCLKRARRRYLRPVKDRDRGLLPAFLLLLARTQAGLPSRRCTFLTWRGCDGFDLLFLRFLLLSIAPLLTLSHDVLPTLSL